PQHAEVAHAERRERAHASGSGRRAGVRRFGQLVAVAHGRRSMMRPMDPFKDRVAVITGGAGGIGAAMAKSFAERGAKIGLADLDEPALEGAVRDLEKSGAQALGVHTDVSKPESVEALAEAALRRFGAVHIVCNNAGIATFGPIAKSTRKDWEFTM